MARKTREWHPKFVEYMDTIITHPNYKGLAITKKVDGSWSWFGTKYTTVGKERITWCENKAKNLGFPIEPGVYAEVMREIHPTKWKHCQICGNTMSIYYHYPSVNFLKSIEKKFKVKYSENDHIGAIWDDLIERGISQKEVIDFMIQKGNLKCDNNQVNKAHVIDMLEMVCRKEGRKLLSPGAMSNFPDRFDGFHTYNRCCRSTQDKGRSKENMKSYTKDRRAFENWSDGNIHAANQFMGSEYFQKITADHIGPISLGFVHDPRYIQPMSGTDNSSKRDRLQLVDIQIIIETQKRTNIYPMSWYSKIIWEHIQTNYLNNTDLIPGIYRDALKQNFSNYMHILWNILEQCGNEGANFLDEVFLKPKYKFFNFSYTFNHLGEITDQKPRHFTDRNRNEADRFRRIAFESVYDFNKKENRNIKSSLSESELKLLSQLCQTISSSTISLEQKHKNLIDLVECIQRRIISVL